MNPETTFSQPKSRSGSFVPEIVDNMAAIIRISQSVGYIASISF